MGRWVLVLGASSDIAQHLAKRFAGVGYNLVLASRDLAFLDRFAKDIEIRYGVSVKVKFFDATEFDKHLYFYKSLDVQVDGVILAFGYLGSQEKAQMEFEEARRIIEVNFLGVVSIAEIVARDFEKRGGGFIVAIGSVAGDRGRLSNYIYGASKAALDKYMQGLRNRLCSKGVHVLTVKPGYVRTKMTANLKLPRLLVSSPEKVADDIFKALNKEMCVLYTPWYWKIIMLVVKMIPESLGKRLRW